MYLSKSDMVPVKDGVWTTAIIHRIVEVVGVPYSIVESQVYHGIEIPLRAQMWGQFRLHIERQLSPPLDSF